MFRCVSLPGGCVSSMFVNAGCVSVLLHVTMGIFYHGVARKSQYAAGGICILILWMSYLMLPMVNS